MLHTIYFIYLSPTYSKGSLHIKTTKLALFKHLIVYIQYLLQINYMVFLLIFLWKLYIKCDDTYFTK